MKNFRIVNEYEANQGIKPHTDAPAFGPNVASISLLSPVVMDFRNKTTFQKAQLALEPRSILVMTGESRTDWTHGNLFIQNR